MNTSIGIDVSATKLDVAILREGKKAWHKQYKNDPTGFAGVLAKIGSLRAPRVTMEATGVYHLDLAFSLHESEVEVMVVNPRQAKRFVEARARNTQTDKVDATELAEYGQRMTFVPWQAPSANVMALHKIGRAIGGLTKLHTATLNRQHAALATAQTPKSVLKLHANTLKFIDKQRELLSREGRAVIARDALLERRFTQLVSIKGVAETSAIALLAELMVLPDALSASAWVKYAGLDPSGKKSGTSVETKPRISKRGNRRLRAALYMPAMSAKTHDPNMRAFAERLIAAHKTKLQAVVAVQRKLLHGIHAMFKSNSLWDSTRLVGNGPTAAKTN
jgi:transposase